MRKKVIVLVVLVVAALVAPAAYAALSGQQKDEINALNRQIVELRKQIVDKYVQGDEITEEQGKQYKDWLDRAEKNREDGTFTGCGGVDGSGAGMMGGSGAGMMGGSGAGMMGGSGAGMMGGYRNSVVY